MFKLRGYEIKPMAGYSMKTGKEVVSFDVYLNNREIATFETMKDAEHAIVTNADVLYYGSRI